MITRVLMTLLFMVALGSSAIRARPQQPAVSLPRHTERTIAQVPNPTIPQPADFGAPSASQYPILFNDHHVYAQPNILKQGRVLAGIVRGGTLTIPLRSMFEQMGATVSYDESSNTVMVSKPGAEVKMTVGKPEVIINGESRPLDVPPAIYEGAVVVPVRVISEGMGAYVQWVSDRRIVVVRYIPATPPPSPAPPPPPPPPPSPTSIPTVLTSLTALFNQSNPEKCSTCPHFGRYTYVILTDSSDRSLALLQALFTSGSHASATSIHQTIGQLGSGAEYKSVNLFLLAAKMGTNIPSVYTPQQALAAYDLFAAGRLRDKYCVQRNNSICIPPADRGPILLIFLVPVSGIPYGTKLPNALAVDLSAVPNPQFPHVVDVVERVMNVPGGYHWGDRLQPLSPVDTTVAQFFNTINTQLLLIPGAQVFLEHVLGQ